MTTEAPDWLNGDFMRKVLRNSANDDSIEVIELVNEPAVEKGDNYGSIMFRSNVKYSRDQSGLKITEEKSLIIKISPTVEGIHKDMLTTINVFETEIKMMTTLCKMNDLLNESDYRLNASVLYTELGDPSFLVIEDLATLGYRMADRQKGLDFEHCILAIQGLAKFHASSVALCEKNPNAILTYNGGVYKTDYPNEWKDFFIGAMKRVASEVLQWTELGPRAQSYSEKLMKLSDVCYDRVARCSRPKDNEFNVLNHGDCWLNNMLFRYNDDGKVTNHIFIDFQLSLWSSPAIDILNFLNTSSDENVDIHHREHLLSEYLTILRLTMLRLCCKTKPPTMTELQRSLEEHELYGILSTCVILPIVLLDKNDALSYDDLLAQPKSNNDNSMYKGLAYRKFMIRRLAEWDARGSIDV